jgi:GT2 family glycosyltransferase
VQSNAKSTDENTGVSIVMAVKDNLEWTRKGIESIRAHTRMSYELIIIDNGSAPETSEYLEEASDILIRNDENRGCAGAWNQGILAARRRYICIVNNDIEVPTGWLTKLVDVLEKTDYVLVSPAVREGEFDYDLDQYNLEFSERLGNRLFPSEFRGIAMLSKRDLYDRIGMYDEAYQIGKYEDEDMFMRIKEENQDVATTSSVLLHHYGSKTVNSEKRVATFDFERENRSVFLRKWRKKYLWRKARKVRIRWRQRSVHRRFNLTY